MSGWTVEPQKMSACLPLLNFLSDFKRYFDGEALPRTLLCDVDCLQLQVYICAKCGLMILDAIAIYCIWVWKRAVLQSQENSEQQKSCCRRGLSRLLSASRKMRAICDACKTWKVRMASRSRGFLLFRETHKQNKYLIYIYMLCIWMLLRAKFHKHETQQLAARAGVLWLSPAWSQWFCRISRHLQGVQPGSCPCASAGALQCSVSRPPVQATHLSPQKTLTIRIATLERCK